MAFDYKITEEDLQDRGVLGLPDTPNLSTSDMQRKFEETAREVIIPKLNALIDALNSEEATESLVAVNPITQAVESLQQILDALNNAKVSVEDGKGLSTNDYDDAEKAKVALIDSLVAVAQMLDGITGVTSSVIDDATKLPTSKAIIDYVVALGGGDMLKSVYDTNGNGVVDDAEKLGGKAPSEYASAQDVEDIRQELENIDMSADGVTYDNTASGLEAITAQGAIDELNQSLTQSKQINLAVYDDTYYETTSLCSEIVGGNYVINFNLLVKQSFTSQSDSICIKNLPFTWVYTFEFTAISQNKNTVLMVGEENTNTLVIRTSNVVADCYRANITIPSNVIN